MGKFLKILTKGFQLPGWKLRHQLGETLCLMLRQARASKCYRPLMFGQKMRVLGMEWCPRLLPSARW